MYIFCQSSNLSNFVFQNIILVVTSFSGYLLFSCQFSNVFSSNSCSFVIYICIYMFTALQRIKISQTSSGLLQVLVSLIRCYDLKSVLSLSVFCSLHYVLNMVGVSANLPAFQTPSI